jgi:hypothetical protein
MKKMKNLKFALTLVIVGLFLITMSSCKKCKNEDPRAKIINNGTQKASVQIKTSNGNTVNINNIDPGTSSPYNSYAAGQVTFTITVSSNDYVKTFDMGKCYYYDIAIDANNNITSVPTDRND